MYGGSEKTPAVAMIKNDLSCVQQYYNMEIQDTRLAVLIDADNVPYSNVKGMMEEIAKYGTPTFRRIYGDWTKPTVSGWKGCAAGKCHHPDSAIQLYQR